MKSSARERAGGGGRRGRGRRGVWIHARSRKIEDKESEWRCRKVSYAQRQRCKVQDDDELRL